VKQVAAKKHDGGAVEMLIIPIGTSVSIHGEAGGIVTAHATIEGLQIYRHHTMKSEVMFLTQES
jgi:hypothetical protein